MRIPTAVLPFFLNLPEGTEVTLPNGEEALDLSVSHPSIPEGVDAVTPVFRKEGQVIHFVEFSPIHLPARHKP
jgi:hypothetical protein